LEDRFLLDNKFLSLSASEDGTKLFGKVLICPLDVGNSNKKGIKQTDLSDEQLKTLEGQPIVCKVIKNSDGYDLAGHQMKKVKEYNPETKKDEIKVIFDTNPIGYFSSASIEEIELDGEKLQCIVSEVVFWLRYDKAMSVIERLFFEGNLHTSWEVTYADKYEENGIEWLTDITFFGVCALGSTVIPAYDKSGVIELSELDNTDIDFELAQAFTEDLIKEQEQTQVQKVQEIQDSTIQVDISSNIETEEVDINTQEISQINEQGGEKMDKSTKEIASLTDSDLYTRVRQAINSANPNDWFYISYLFPMEYRAIAHNWESLDTKFVEFKYTVNSDETISITSQTNVEMQFILVSEIETMVAEKDAKDAEIATLTVTITEKETELSAKIEAITKLGEDIASKESEIAELVPFKEKIEAVEQAEKEAELAQKKEDLKVLAQKGGFLSEEDIQTPEIAEMIENLDEKSIKACIAEKVIAKYEVSEAEKKASEELALAEKAKESATKEVEVSEVKTQTPKTNINTSTDDITNPLSIMDKFLKN